MKRLPLLAVLLALVLTACGGRSHADFNKADVTFAQQMIPHHQQAVAMSRMAKSHAASSDVRALADKIAAAQGPEIARMNRWLAAWDRPLRTNSSMGSMGHDHMGHGSMPGMMGAGQMRRLDKARGAAFDRMFLSMMIAHHQGAVDMAQTERVSGSNDSALALAKRIETSQQAEIAKMKQLLRS